MLLYATLGTNDMVRAVRFWGAVMAALGIPRLADAEEDPGWAFWGEPYERGFSLCLCRPFDGAPATAGNGSMLALRCAEAGLVDRAHAAGLAAGGRDDGAPGLRAHYGPGFYAGYLRDPDGHKLALVCHDHRPAAAQGD